MLNSYYDMDTKVKERHFVTDENNHNAKRTGVIKSTSNIIYVHEFDLKRQSYKICSLPNAKICQKIQYSK